MNAFLEKLKTKYDYDNEMLSFLQKLIPCLISYYGEDKKDLILEALDNCEIHLQKEKESVKDYLNKYFDMNKDWYMPTLAGAMYHNQMKVQDGNVLSKYIIYICTCSKSGYNYSPFNFDNENNIHILVHEICHLIKGYNKAKVVDDKVVDYTGLSKDIYSYNSDTGVIDEQCEEVHIGVEEAFNEVDAYKITKLMTGKETKGSYKLACKCALKLVEDEKFANIIKQSQFYSDNKWIQYFGEKDSSTLIEIFDIYIKYLLVSFSEIDTKEKRAARAVKLKETVQKFINFYDIHYKASETSSE